MPDRTCVDCSCPAAGKSTRCLDCRRKHRNALNAGYRSTDPDKYRECDRRWRAQNLEKARENWKRYYWKNPDPIRSRCLNWHATNPERSAELKLAWNSANRERARQSAREWSQRHPERVRINGASRRARKRDAFVEEIDPCVVFERDGWICGLCGEPIHSDIPYPDGRCASVDHIVPLFHGGEHSYENVQAAHLSCNISKGAQLCE